MNRKLSIAEAKARFAEAVRRAEAGETLVLTRHGRPVARLVPARREALADDVREPEAHYEGAVDIHKASESAAHRREALERLLRETIWPRVPKQQLGKALTKAEREKILGYGGEGA